MDITHREVDGVILIQLSGRLDSSVSGDVMDKLNALVTAGPPRVVLNLKDLAYISSAGLRSILVAAKLAHSMNGELRLCETNPDVTKVFVTSGFTNLIRLDESESLSLAALRQG